VIGWPSCWRERPAGQLQPRTGSRKMREVPTCKMRERLQGFTAQFTHTNTPRLHDDRETGDAWAWIVPVCNRLITEDRCRLHFEIYERNFAYFLLHVCLWIILDEAQNITIFSRYLQQHYRKIKLQFAVIKIRKRSRIAILAMDHTQRKVCVRKLRSYK